MTSKSRLIATAAVLMLISFAALAVLPDLAAVLSPQAAAMLTDPNTATAALAVAAAAAGLYNSRLLSGTRHQPAELL